jgi:hypothetical protein
VRTPNSSARSYASALPIRTFSTQAYSGKKRNDFCQYKQITQFLAALQHIFNRKFVLKTMFIVKICRKFLHFTAETKVLSEQVFDSLGKFISGTQNALVESLSALFNISQCVLATHQWVRIMSSGNVFIVGSTRTGAVVAKIAKTQNRTTGKFLKSIIAAAALSTCAMAQADVTLTFEAEAESPFFFNNDRANFGDYWIETYNGSGQEGFVGSLVDGSTNDICFNVSCPVNNKSTYYAALDDSFIVFGLTNNTPFKLQSLQASFIGAGQAVPSLAGILVLQGYDKNFNAIASATMQLGLSGPTGGAYNFGNYNTSAFSNTLVSAVRVLGYACDAATNCNRSTNLANFAIDNIVTVPEPMTLALFGLGLAGLGASRRRRA